MTEVSASVPSQNVATPASGGETTQWISRPISENVTEAMNATPLGNQYEIVYAVLAARLKKAFTEGNQLSQLLQTQFANTSVNFRALNPTFFPHPAQPAPPNPGSYHSQVWGPNAGDSAQVLPHTPQQAINNPLEVAGDPVKSRGVLIAKLFADLRSHIPLVLFNITGKQYVPTSIGGQSFGKMLRKDGKLVKELVYRTILSVEVLAVTYDDTSTSNLASCIEAVFGTLRDEIDDGAYICGSRWALTLPTNLQPSGITEVDAPWSQGDKEGKLYTATVTMENIAFECVGHVEVEINDNYAAGFVSGPVAVRLSSEPSNADLTAPITLRLGGGNQRLSVVNLPIEAVVVADSERGRRVVDLVRGAGAWELVPRRMGRARIRVLNQKGGGIAPVDGTAPSGRASEEIAYRDVEVIA